MRHWSMGIQISGYQGSNRTNDVRDVDIDSRLFAGLCKGMLLVALGGALLSFPLPLQILGGAIAGEGVYNLLRNSSEHAVLTMPTWQSPVGLVLLLLGAVLLLIAIYFHVDAAAQWTHQVEQASNTSASLGLRFSLAALGYAAVPAITAVIGLRLRHDWSVAALIGLGSGLVSILPASMGLFFFISRIVLAHG